MVETKVKTPRESKLPTGRAKKFDIKLEPEEMIRAGLHFGHRTSRIHPKMMPYLGGIRNAVHLIDLEKTAEKLKEALNFIQQVITENKILLIIGTKIQTKDLVKKTAKDCGIPYVTERWLGGTLTNFETIKNRLEYFKELERKRKEGEFEKYTKKERAKIDQELRNLETKFGGIKNLERLPDAIFVFDMRKDALAAKEARMKGVKVIGVADTNVDPTLADYPIPANDDAASSVKYILDKVKEVIQKCKVKNEK